MCFLFDTKQTSKNVVDTTKYNDTDEIETLIKLNDKGCLHLFDIDPCPLSKNPKRT